MPKASPDDGTVKKPARRRSAKPPVKRQAAALARTRGTATRKAAPRRTKALKPTELVETESPNPPVIPAQPVPPMPKRVVSEAPSEGAAKPRAEGSPRAAHPRTLPATYGENHLLLLVRDPATLFAAWDMAPATVESLKARLGRRGYAVSNLTLRLIQAGGPTHTVHSGKNTRSRYLKVSGGHSYVAEIGVTLPSGRFELLARSAPCLVPSGTSGVRPGVPPPSARSVLGYRAARVQVRRVLSAARPKDGSKPSKASRGWQVSKPPQPLLVGIEVPATTRSGMKPLTSRPSSARILGGSSDLYRR